jgi:HlyD family secretion protein
MQNKLKGLGGFLRSHKIWTVIIILLVLVSAWYFINKSSENVKFAEVTVVRGSLSEIVSVTGNVKPFSDVSLAFERGGRVSNVYAVVGDRVSANQVLASVSNADLSANLDQAKANLKITELQLGSKTDKVSLDLAQAKTSLINNIKDSFTKADDALQNKIYSLFNNPARYNSKLIFTADSSLQKDIEDGRNIASDMLDIWYLSLGKLDNNSDLVSYYNSTKENLVFLKKLLDQCAEAVNGLTTDSANATQIQIDTWKLNISSARTSIDSTINSLVNSGDQYQVANLAMKNSQTDLSIQSASIEQARAGVSSAEAELAKSVIKSPVDGVITKIDIKIGETVTANKDVVSVISYGQYEIESFVPEADIAKIKIGDLASTTLDAYGSSVNFETMVIKIDPAATVIDGVPTYKVTLKFINKDDRVKSGMTANLDIMTEKKDGVLVIPTRVVISENNKKYVNVLGIGDGAVVTKVEVVTGLRGVDGFVEIVSGLKEGDKVVTVNI